MVKSTKNKEDAYDIVKDMILKSELKPGSKVSKNELTELLGIGETPVREIIFRLNREGLFQVIPQSGTYVSKIDLQEVYEAIFVRETLEKLIIMEACDVITEEQIKELEMKIQIQKIYDDVDDYDSFFEQDEEFHAFFYLIADKLHVWKWLQLLNLQLNRYRYLRLEVKELPRYHITEGHENLVKLIKEKRKPELEEAISKHLHLIDNDAAKVIKAFPDYFE